MALQLVILYNLGRIRPKTLFPSHLRSIRAITAVENMELGTYHFTHGPKYDIFGDEAWDLCWELDRAKS